MSYLYTMEWGGNTWTFARDPRALAQ